MTPTTLRIAALDAATAAHEEADRLASAGQFTAAALAFDRLAAIYDRAGFPQFAHQMRGLAGLYREGAHCNPAQRNAA